MAYSKELKKSIVAKMLPPTNQSLRKIQQESGVPKGTLKKWKRELRDGGLAAAPIGDQTSDKWSSRDKFLIVPAKRFKLSEIYNPFGGFAQSFWEQNYLVLRRFGWVTPPK